ARRPAPGHRGAVPGHRRAARRRARPARAPRALRPARPLGAMTTPGGPESATGIDVRDSVSLVPALGHGRPQIAHRLDPPYAAMRPAELLPLIQELAAAIDTSEVDCVLGFPEGGVLPAFAFAQLVGRPLVLSTRLRLALPGAVAFTSGQGTDHFVHGLAQ